MILAIAREASGVLETRQVMHQLFEAAERVAELQQVLAFAVVDRQRFGETEADPGCIVIVSAWPLAVRMA